MPDSPNDQDPRTPPPDRPEPSPAPTGVQTVRAVLGQVRRVLAALAERRSES